MTRFTLLLEKGRLEKREFEISQDSITLGSATLNDIALPGDVTVARVHAEIRRSANGMVAVAPIAGEVTLLNGKAISGLTPLKVGDRIAIGKLYQFRVGDGDADVPPVASADQPASASGAQSMFGRKLPTWVVVYLIGMALAATYLMFSRPSTEGSLTAVSAREVQFANARQLQQADTDRVIRLLTQGQVLERQGKSQAAYEVYRDVMGARRPAQPESPAYRFAAARMVVVGTGRR